MSASIYPEHEKLKAIQAESRAQGEFLAWLQDEKDLSLCEMVGSGPDYYPVRESTLDLLAEYHGIDQNKLEQEKRDMLDLLRAEHENRQPTVQVGFEVVPKAPKTKHLKGRWKARQTKLKHTNVFKDAKRE